MRFHASLLAAVCYALSLPFVPGESLFNRHEPNIERVAATNDEGNWSSGALLPRIFSHETTLETVAVSTLSGPGADLIRTTARLTVPAGEHWQTALANESLIFTLESGELRVSLENGHARIARAGRVRQGSPALDEITAGQQGLLQAGDQLVAHGDSALTVQSDGAHSVATIIRVGVPATP